MRIISQDGKYDTPYEMTQIWVRESESSHQILGSMPADEIITIATYTSKEKAEKAMEMMRKAYTGSVAIFQNVEPTNEVVKALKRQDTEIVYAELDNQPSEIKLENHQNFYFQFPKDEELE